MTLREIVYMILDECKSVSDDSQFNEEHVIFLVGNYRTAILKREMEKPGKTLSKNSYQRICLQLEQFSPFRQDVCAGTSYLRSTDEVPSTIDDRFRIYPTDISQTHIVHVYSERFPYTGNNKWMTNIIYATKNTDNRLYLKSSNPQFKYLEKVTLEGVFEDFMKANELSCDECGCDNSCEPLDMTFPLDKAFVEELIQYVVKELLGAMYRPRDSKNDSEDDLSDLIAWARKNMKSDMQKRLENGVQ